jgi:predicted nucleotidyltransferase component of viral defense system
MPGGREAIEIFHLQFLRVLGARVDRKLYVLKGGCNLRFFAKSIRYSEDIDLDIAVMQSNTLRGTVQHVLAARALIDALATRGISITQSTAPKQTETAQRWKIRLRVEDSAQEIPTKIEFCRRGLDPGVALESVDPELLRRYRLPPILVQHYLPEAAFRQKIGALAHRNQIQARDVFDLNLLLDAGAGKEPLPQPLGKSLPKAVENAMGVGYDEFAGQVLAYLEADYQDHYRKRQIWHQIQARVTQALEALQP